MCIQSRHSTAVGSYKNTHKKIYRISLKAQQQSEDASPPVLASSHRQRLVTAEIPLLNRAGGDLQAFRHTNSHGRCPTILETLHAKPHAPSKNTWSSREDPNEPSLRCGVHDLMSTVHSIDNNKRVETTCVQLGFGKCFEKQRTFLLLL